MKMLSFVFLIVVAIFGIGFLFVLDFFYESNRRHPR